jgi:CubicO group peptidase (beta-lactamase class C family)
MVNTPGNAWFYNSGCQSLLFAIIEKATGMSALDFAFTYLFDPLGIEQDEVDWTAWRWNGQIMGWAGLSLSARNMAKIGLLALNNGTWDGEQILPEDWIVNSTRVYYGNYGYGWFIESDTEAATALGWRGVRIRILPKINVVWVDTGYGLDRGLLLDYIIPSVIPPTTTTTTPPPIPVELIVVASGAAVVVVIAIVVFRRRQ